MALIDFSSCPVINTKLYGGSNGKKIGIIFNNEKYLLKFSSKNNGKYSNSVISEYIACHIFNLLGFSTQETLLGKYKNGKKYLVVLVKILRNQIKYFMILLHLKILLLIVVNLDLEQNLMKCLALY